jgi:hypothetical protein
MMLVFCSAKCKKYGFIEVSMEIQRISWVVKQCTVRTESLQTAFERARCEVVRMNASCQGDYQRWLPESWTI